jgi:hypothetical protein
MELRGNGDIWGDSHYLPFLIHFAYLLPRRRKRWNKFPSLRYLVFPALLAKRMLAWIKFWNCTAFKGGALKLQ